MLNGRVLLCIQTVVNVLVWRTVRVTAAAEAVAEFGVRRPIPTTNMEAILGLLVLGAIVGMWFVLIRKAGYETGKAVLMAIGMLIPLLNLGILIYFIATTWPIQAELAALRALIHSRRATIGHRVWSRRRAHGLAGRFLDAGQWIRMAQAMRHWTQVVA